MPYFLIHSRKFSAPVIQHIHPFILTFMRNKELEQSLIPGRTSFILNTNVKESYKTRFQNTVCKLVNHAGQKNWYLIETRQNFTGMHFLKGTVEVNKFLILIRNPLAFRRDKKQDVIVYMPSDINNPGDFELSRTKLVSWAQIEKIENNI